MDYFDQLLQVTIIDPPPTHTHSHQQRKHQKVAGQQALKMLITHTTAKRQGSKVAQLLPPSPHVLAHSPNGFVGEILFLLSRIHSECFLKTRMWGESHLRRYPPENSHSSSLV